MIKPVSKLAAEAWIEGLGEVLIELKDNEIARLTARVEELEKALRPLACTCEAESQDECSRSEKHCPFWRARAAITKGERE